jgi:5'-3' exonuclease
VRQAVSMPAILLDTASLYWRAYFALPDSITDSEGKPVNALRGLLDTIAAVVQEYPQHRVIACWDEDWRPQWRVDLVPTYKAHRVIDAASGELPGNGSVEETPDLLSPQIPMIRQVLEALGVLIAASPECEADDVIATYCQGEDRIADEIVIVSGDRDLLQLVDEHTTMLYTGGSSKSRGGRPWLEFTPHEVVSKYGVEPSQYADMATLRGDASDGLSGVSGIGEKTAVALVRAFGDIHGIMLAATESPPSKPMTPRLAASLVHNANLVSDTYSVIALKGRKGVSPPPPPTVPDRDFALVLAQKFGVVRSVDRLLSLLPG